jgi:hypothetical protein
LRLMSPGARRTRGEAANGRRRRCPEDRSVGTPYIGTRQWRVPITGWGALKRGPRGKVTGKAHFSVRRASRADAAEIGTIHVKATRFAYRGIYSDAYLDGLSPEVRAEKWIEAGKGALASDDPEMAVFVACDGAPTVAFSCARRSESDERAAELFALYLDPTVIGKRGRLGRAHARPNTRGLR